MSELNRIRLYTKLLLAFMLLICLGLSFDLFDRYNKYGWFYTQTIIINGVKWVNNISLKDGLVFCLIFWFFMVLTLEILILIDKIKSLG